VQLPLPAIAKSLRTEKHKINNVYRQEARIIRHRELTDRRGFDDKNTKRRKNTYDTCRFGIINKYLMKEF
jgi:hypothetical protein